MGKSGQNGRGFAKPWEYVDAETNTGLSLTGWMNGRFDRYDSSGFMVDYNMNLGDNRLLRDTYAKDMGWLRENGWLDAQTRAVLVAFTTYNGNFDYWISCTFLLEFP